MVPFPAVAEHVAEGARMTARARDSAASTADVLDAYGALLTQDDLGCSTL